METWGVQALQSRRYRGAERSGFLVLTVVLISLHSQPQSETTHYAAGTYVISPITKPKGHHQPPISATSRQLSLESQHHNPAHNIQQPHTRPHLSPHPSFHLRSTAGPSSSALTPPASALITPRSYLFRYLTPLTRSSIAPSTVIRYTTYASRPSRQPAISLLAPQLVHPSVTLLCHHRPRTMPPASSPAATASLNGSGLVATPSPAGLLLLPCSPSGRVRPSPSCLCPFLALSSSPNQSSPHSFIQTHTASSYAPSAVQFSLLSHHMPPHSIALPRISLRRILRRPFVLASSPSLLHATASNNQSPLLHHTPPSSRTLDISQSPSRTFRLHAINPAAPLHTTRFAPISASTDSSPSRHPRTHHPHPPHLYRPRAPAHYYQTPLPPASQSAHQNPLAHRRYHHRHQNVTTPAIVFAAVIATGTRHPPPQTTYTAAPHPRIHDLPQSSPPTGLPAAS